MSLKGFQFKAQQVSRKRGVELLKVPYDKHGPGPINSLHLSVNKESIMKIKAFT